MIAHIGGFPLEEIAPAVSGTGAGLLLLGRAWVMLHVRRRREPGT